MCSNFLVETVWWSHVFCWWNTLLLMSFGIECGCAFRQVCLYVVMFVLRKPQCLWWRWWRWWWWCCVSEWLLRQYHQHITKLKWVCSTLNTRHNNSPISHLSYLPTKPRTRHLYLTLPVGTVTVEPSFSAMRHIVSVMDLCINTRTCCQSWTCVNTEVHVSVHDVM